MSEEDDLAEISRKVSEILRITQLSQKQLAAKVGSSQPTISKWLNMEQGPRYSQWRAVESWGLQQPRLRHLFVPDLIDRLFLGGPSDNKRAVEILVENHLNTMPPRR